MSLSYSFIVDQVGRHAGQSVDLLDFGCGNGAIVLIARQAGHRACGCDCYNGPWAWLFDEVAVNPRLRDHVRRISAYDALPYPDASFDVVTTNMVFEHVDN